RPDGARSAKQPGRQEQGGLQEGEHRLQGAPHQPEGEGEQPDEGIEDQRQRRERPADHEQEEPDQDLDHRGEPPSLPILLRREGAGSFPRPHPDYDRLASSPWPGIAPPFSPCSSSPPSPPWPRTASSSAR